MNKSRFIYIKIYILINNLQFKAWFLFFVDNGRFFSIKINVVDKFKYINYTYIICVSKTLMPKFDLQVLALEINWLNSSLNNHSFFIWLYI